MKTSRRAFLQTVAAGTAAMGMARTSPAQDKPIQGFEKTAADPSTATGWQPVSDRKLRVGIVGYGVCQFGAQFGFQDHPNVEIVAVSDLFPDRCQKLAEACRCSKTYASLEELVKDDRVEAVFVATDAPSHAKHCLEVLKHGKHVASAVPAVFGSMEDAERLFEGVRKSGLKYMMFETSCFHAEVHAMRRIYQAGGLGKLIYTEGEYYHHQAQLIDSYRQWRLGLPPQWYPTHANAYHLCVSGESFTEVSCLGYKSTAEHLQADTNPHKNPFGTEIALLRSSGGGTSRMAISWDTPGVSGETGRNRGEKGSFYNNYEGSTKDLPDLNRPPLPPGLAPGGHGGSHGYLTNEFITAILQDRKPLVDIVAALNLTVPGIIAHQSALRDGERMKIPQFKL